MAKNLQWRITSGSRLKTSKECWLLCSATVQLDQNGQYKMPLRPASTRESCYLESPSFLEYSDQNTSRHHVWAALMDFYAKACRRRHKRAMLPGVSTYPGVLKPDHFMTPCVSLRLKTESDPTASWKSIQLRCDYSWRFSKVDTWWRC